MLRRRELDGGGYLNTWAAVAVTRCVCGRWSTEVFSGSHRIASVNSPSHTVPGLNTAGAPAVYSGPAPKNKLRSQDEEQTTPDDALPHLADPSRRCANFLRMRPALIVIDMVNDFLATRAPART